jgi:hypothetical protein
LKDAVFRNGIIEFDVAVRHQKSYPGVRFRVQAEGDYELVYLRPHRAGHYTDAIQYTLAFNGVDGWQLYSGGGFTAGAILPPDQWIHVRLEVMGKQARVFLGDGAGGCLFSDFFGRIFRLSPGNEKILLLDGTGPRRHYADFEYIPAKGLLIVPSLYDNDLTAFQYVPDRAKE